MPIYTTPLATLAQHATLADAVSSGAVTTAMLGDSTITSSKIADATVVTADLSSDAVTSAKILDATILGEDILNGTIVLGTDTSGAYDSTSDTIADDGTIVSSEITNETILGEDIFNGTVVLGTDTSGAYDSTVDTIADDGTIDSLEITNGTIAATDLDLTMAPTWTGTHTYSFAGTATNAIDVTASSLTSGSALTLTGPSSGTGITTNGLIKLTSNVGSAAGSSSFGLFNATASLSDTTASRHSTNLMVSTTHSNASGSNYAYGIYSSLDDPVDRGSDGNYGVYSAVTSSGNTGRKNLFGYYTSVDSSLNNTLSGEIVGYGGSVDVVGDSAQTVTGTGVEVSVQNANTTDQGTRNTYGGTFWATGSANGTSRTIGIWARAVSADENYAALFNGHVFVGAGGTSAWGTYGNIPGNSIIVDSGIVCVDNGGTNCDDGARTAGTIYSVGADVTGIDLAENYPTQDETLAAGELVIIDSAMARICLDEGSDNQCSRESTGIVPFVSRSDGPDTAKRVLGVVSTKPGVTLGGFGDEELIFYTKVPIALTGRVPVLVNAEGGPIEMGDRLTVSSEPGVAKKASEGDVVIGLALNDWAGETNTVLVLVGRPEIPAETDHRIDSLIRRIEELEKKLSAL